MTRTKTERWLNRPFKSRYKIAALDKAKRNAEDRATKITTELTGMPGSQSKDPHKFEGVAILSAQLAEMIDYECKVSAEVLNVINMVEDEREQTVLINRYINYEKWEQIASEMGYQPTDTSDGVYRLHRKALDSVGKILDENDKKCNRICKHS